MSDHDDNPASQPVAASWLPAIFFGVVVALAVLFALYALLWDGGAHT